MGTPGRLIEAAGGQEGAAAHHGDAAQKADQGRPRAAGRLVPHVALAILTLGCAGALVGSLLQAPPVAGTLLRAAAGNTAGASSLRVHESIAEVEGTRLVTLDSVSEVAEPPDRIEATEQAVEELVIGSGTYVSTNRGRTWFADTSVHVDVAQAMAAVLAPLQLFRNATGVHAGAGQTRFAFRVPAPQLVATLHLSLPAASSVRSVPVVVHVRGEFVRSWSTQLTVSGNHYVLTESYAGLDHEPLLVVPPLSPAP